MNFVPLNFEEPRISTVEALQCYMRVLDETSKRFDLQNQWKEFKSDLEPIITVFDQCQQLFQPQV